MRTTTARFRPDTDAPDDFPGAVRDIDFAHDPNRSTTLLLMNEALARVRMREVSFRVRPDLHRPARVVAMLAAKRRTQRY